MARTKVHDPVSAAALETLAPVRKSAETSLSDQVYGEILRLIMDGLVPVGSKLPTESEICSRMGVSRTVVREALSRLKIDGLITSRPGQGSVVVKQPKNKVLSAEFMNSIADIQRFFEFRMLIEREAAALAAQRRTSSDLRTLHAAHLSLARDMTSGDTTVTPDLEFHEAVAAAAHNNFLASAIGSMRSDFLQSMQFTRILVQEKMEVRSVKIMREHGKILSAIERGDPQAASDAMAYHLQATRDRIFMAEDTFPDYEDAPSEPS